MTLQMLLLSKNGAELRMLAFLVGNTIMVLISLFRKTALLSLKQLKNTAQILQLQVLKLQLYSKLKMVLKLHLIKLLQVLISSVLLTVLRYLLTLHTNLMIMCLALKEHQILKPAHSTARICLYPVQILSWTLTSVVNAVGLPLMVLRSLMINFMLKAESLTNHL